MTYPDSVPAPLQAGQPSENMVTLAHLIYALHGFAVFTGVIGSATILGSFIASVPSIIAVVLNYIKQDAVRGTWLESHFRWQIRTFWFAVLWVMVAVMLVLTIIGLPFAMMLLIGASLWVLYRVIRGWWTLLQRNSLPIS